MTYGLTTISSRPCHRNLTGPLTLKKALIQELLATAEPISLSSTLSLLNASRIDHIYEGTPVASKVTPRLGCIKAELKNAIYLGNLDAKT